jgi:hypothetical protein
MRPGRIALLLTGIACLVVVGLLVTGQMPWLVGGWPELLGSRGAPSADASPSTDAGSDAGPPKKPRAAPLSSAELGAPLVHGAFVTACGTPPDMKVVVKVAVKMGRAVEVAVTTEPPDPVIAACIEKATRDLQWEASRKTDHVTVRY